MKKHTEKPPIDELFARKLGNMSLPPSADGLARLQARMGQPTQPAQLAVWRNPAFQRYMAAAACLVLVCLFGWLYWPITGAKPKTTEQALATNQRGRQKTPATKVGTATNQSLTEEQLADQTAKRTLEQTGQQKPSDQLAQVSPDQKPTIPSTDAEPQVTKENRTAAPVKKNDPVPVSHTNEPVLAQQQKAVQEKTSVETSRQDINVPAISTKTEQVAANTSTQAAPKPASRAEHILVVTIAEPEALVAARQAAQQAKGAPDVRTEVAMEGKTVRESKAGSFWKQLKRVKDGEVFARREKADDEDRGLIGRAYSELKQTIDKDKSDK